MAKSKCKFCHARKETGEGRKTPVGFFCDIDHAMQYGKLNQDTGRKKLMSVRKKESEEQEKKERKRIKSKLKELKPRKYWLDKLQALVNQYITKVRDLNETCCTCDTADLNSSYDAGHFFSRGARSDLSFVLKNIHKQCVACNQYGGGKPKEYTDFIISKYGQEHLDWLTDRSQHKDLKEQFPNWQDIEKEIIRYRKLLRNNGVEPIT